MDYEKIKERELDLLKEIVGTERMSVGESILDLHGKDESFHPKRKPDVVLRPLRVEKTSQILKIADAKQIPVRPQGNHESQ